MGVPCPRCARSYDVTLFAFGRTIHCACGERVGLAQRIPLRRGGPPRFAADAMLGRLARWLRLLGIDTFWEAGIDDAELVRRALAEGRVILTRDRRLPEEWRVDDVYRVETRGPSAQLREVVVAFDLTERLAPLSRCSRCNTPLAESSLASVRERVPTRVAAEQERFLRCPQCERVYWRGSHARRIARVAASLRGDGVPV